MQGKDGENEMSFRLPKIIATNQKLKHFQTMQCEWSEVIPFQTAFIRFISIKADNYNNINNNQ